MGVNRRLSLLANLILFQAGWIAAVAGGYWGRWVALGCLLIHFLTPLRAPGDLRLTIVVAIAGTALDSLLMHLQVLRFPQAQGWLVPLWLTVVWSLFAITLQHSLAWLRHSTALAILLGATAGPLSYFAATRLGALEFPELWISLLWLSLQWALLLPLLLRFAPRLAPT